MGEQVLPIVKTRRKKSIGLKSKATQLELHVPQHLSDRAIVKILARHAAWIERRVALYQSQLQASFQFKAGERLLFKGEDIGFELQKQDSLRRVQIELLSNHFVFRLPGNRTNEADLSVVLKKPLQAWYKQQAELYFEQKMPLFAQQIGVHYQSIQVKTYKSRWGSCYPDGRIQFNWKLMQAPSWVIDYVMVHELCHLKHANHSAAFWQLVEQHYPQTQAAKQWLKQHQRPLIEFLS